MVRRLSGAPWVLVLVAAVVLAAALPVAAQSSGTVSGVVKDEKGNAIDGAKVTIEASGTGRRFEARTNKKGEFIQIGLSPGTYMVGAEKDKLVAQPSPVQIRVGSPSKLELVLGAATAASRDAAAALRKVFSEGVALSQAGKHDEAIAKFNEAIAANATCNECYNNIGYSYAQKKEWDQAEAAYKKSIEIKADDGSAYGGLATVYNAQRKFDQAAEASKKAAEFSGGAAGAAGGGGNADGLFNQGVILWNAGKIPEAKKAFEGAVQANPQHAEAHYQLGMALVNEGNLAGAASEFETYLKLSPEGANAATAKSLLAQLKK
jgi:tetratricopeptide (TPR) repeat protein